MRSVTVTICAALLLTGCGNSANMNGADKDTAVGDGTFGGSLGDYRVPLDDGRTVTCVVYDGYKAGGVSCDWANAK